MGSVFFYKFSFTSVPNETDIASIFLDELLTADQYRRVRYGFSHFDSHLCIFQTKHCGHLIVDRTHYGHSIGISLNSF